MSVVAIDHLGCSSLTVTLGPKEGKCIYGRFVHSERWVDMKAWGIPIPWHVVGLWAGPHALLGFSAACGFKGTQLPTRCKS